jgi:hypothetical protein
LPRRGAREGEVYLDEGVDRRTQETAGTRQRRVYPTIARTKGARVLSVREERSDDRGHSPREKARD